MTRGTQRNGGTERIAMSINTLTICEWETDLISNIFKLPVPGASELFYEQPRECDDGRYGGKDCPLPNATARDYFKGITQ